MHKLNHITGVFKAAFTGRLLWLFAVCVCLIGPVTSSPAFAGLNDRVPSFSNHEAKLKKKEQANKAFKSGNHDTGDSGSGYYTNGFRNAPQGNETYRPNRAIEKSVCREGDGFTARMVPCMRSIIDAAVEGILKSMDTLLNSAMLAAIILAVTLFGVQILSGSSQRPGPDAFVLLLKIGFVLIFTNILLKGYDSQMFNLFGIMEDMSGYAMSYISNDNSTLLKGCSAVGNGQLMIWQQVDCILERLFAGDEQDGASVLWILAHAVLWSNILGLFVFVAMVQIFVMILLLVLRCVTVFLTAYIMLGFLILISPLIVPMILFERTAQYFQVWLRQVLAMFVQPLILFAFMTFCFALLDTVFFGSDDPNIPDGVALSDILGDGWENPHRVPVYYIGDGNPDGSRTLQDAMRDFQERRGISEDCDKAEDDKECQQWKAEIKNYQKYLENRTQVIGVGVAAMKREYLINIDLHVTEEAVSQIPAVGGWGPVKNAAKVVDEVASWTADKVAHWLIPFKVWRVQDTSIFMDLLKFFLGLLFFLPVMNEFVKQMPELVRGLSSARRVSGMTVPGETKIADNVVGAAGAIKGGSVEAAKGAAIGAVKGAAKGAATGGKAGAIKGAVSGAAKEAAKRGAKGATKGRNTAIGKYSHKDRQYKDEKSIERERQRMDSRNTNRGHKHGN